METLRDRNFSTVMPDKMRTETEIKNLIIDLSTKDERIRAVLLNGSRANPNIKPDKYRDFDLVFIVRNIESFISSHDWTNVFGEKLVWQLPGEMILGKDVKSIGFGYLMLFKDKNRIDLTLFPIEQVKNDFKKDSLTIVWVDKDKLFTNIPPSNDSDYHILKPAEKEFLETCNEFWWVSTYVAKGLSRNEIIYAKAMMETVVRPMFMKLIEWKIGYENDFSVSFGKAGRFMGNYLRAGFYSKVLQTYPDAKKENIWHSLLMMAELFKQLADEFSAKFKFRQNKIEQENTISYLKQMYQER